MSLPTSEEELQPGTCLPTHGRSIAEQKQLFVARAQAHRNAMLKQASAAPETHTTGDMVKAATQSKASAEARDSGNEITQPAAAADISDAAANKAPDGAAGLSEGLEALRLAGGDLSALAALEGSERTAAFKDLGFKGLQTRRKLENELTAWQTAQKQPH